MYPYLKPLVKADNQILATKKQILEAITNPGFPSGQQQSRN